MGKTAFKAALIACGLLLAVSATPFPGAMIGFLCGIAVAFFLAPLMVAMQALAGALGADIGLPAVLWALGGVYAVLILTLGIAAWRHWRRGDAPMARDRCARAVLFATLPGVALLSVQQLQAAWP